MITSLVCVCIYACVRVCVCVQSTLALEWRAWLTERLMDDYFAGRTFYSLQAQAAVDNPDQRIQSDAA